MLGVLVRGSVVRAAVLPSGNVGPGCFQTTEGTVRRRRPQRLVLQMGPIGFPTGHAHRRPDHRLRNGVQRRSRARATEFMGGLPPKDSHEYPTGGRPSGGRVAILVFRAFVDLRMGGGALCGCHGSGAIPLPSALGKRLGGIGQGLSGWIPATYPGGMLSGRCGANGARSESAPPMPGPPLPGSSNS